MLNQLISKAVISSVGKERKEIHCGRKTKRKGKEMCGNARQTSCSPEKNAALLFFFEKENATPPPLVSSLAKGRKSSRFGAQAHRAEQKPPPSPLTRAARLLFSATHGGGGRRRGGRRREGVLQDHPHLRPQAPLQSVSNRLSLPRI